MTTQHTPGPWFPDFDDDPFDIGTFAIKDDFDTPIAHVEGWDGEEDTAKQAKANARLIAAAPSMLATLQVVLESMGDYYDATDAAGEEGANLHDLVESTIHQATHQDE